MTLRRAVGQGTVYQRSDGRYEAALYVRTTSGTRKRIRFYAWTRAEAHAKLAAALNQARNGVPVPDRSWRIGEYLQYWLPIVRDTRRPQTYRTYESIARLYLIPNLGKVPLTQLTVGRLQRYLEEQLKQGCSVRTLQKQRTVLSAALTRAQREELLIRNVAHHVEVPRWQRKRITPWTTDQLAAFLAAARDEPLYPAFVLLTLYGLRSGEARGLTWSDVDFGNKCLHIRHQLQLYEGGFHIDPVKTESGERDLPLLQVAESALLDYRQKANPERELVFTNFRGNPISGFVMLRALRRISEAANLPRITIHHLRHTTATLLKNIGVSARDAQLILGHANITTTQQIYQHADMAGQLDALSRLQAQLVPAASDSTQTQPYTQPDGNGGPTLPDRMPGAARAASRSQQTQPSSNGPQAVNNYGNLQSTNAESSLFRPLLYQLS